MPLRVLTACLFSAAAVFAQPAPVPSQYQPIYNTLSSQISAFDASVRADWNGSVAPVLYSPQLEAADSTQYATLLSTNYYDYNVAPELTEIQALGSNSVTVHISFPILYQPFYSQNPALYQEFVSFYQRVANDVRARGMKLIVESVVGRPFAGNDAGAFSSYLKSLSWADYMTGRAQNALNVAQIIQPDYLSVITEPDSEAQVSGQSDAGTVNGSTQLLQSILSALVDDGVPQVVVGAGAGSWIADFAGYMQNFTATSIDYYDLHIYPIDGADLMNVLSAADTIHAAGKQVAISEFWTYKLSNNAFENLTPTQIYARDPFTFWIPIDIAFLQCLSDFANYKQLLFLSPYWTHYLSAYLDYNSEKFKTNAKILTDSDTAAYNAVLAGSFTPTGMAWEQLAHPVADTDPPAAPSAPFANAVYLGTVQLSWAPTTDNVGVAGYQLYRNGLLVTTTSMLSYIDQSLTEGATYSYSLAAFDASGNVSTPSAPLVIVTPNTNPPSTPKNLQVTSNTATSVALAWSASTPPSRVAGYNVLRGLTQDSLLVHATTTDTSFVDDNSPSTTYYYAVQAFNAQGSDSHPSTTLDVTTPAR